jgi:hypothetical protein
MVSVRTNDLFDPTPSAITVDTGRPRSTILLVEQRAKEVLFWRIANNFLVRSRLIPNC